MTMPLTKPEMTGRVRKRVQYEALEFELQNGYLRVRNGSHAESENHEYTVRIEDDLLTACTRPVDAKYSGACKHRVAVALRRPILDAVRHHRLLANGGETVRPLNRSLDHEENSEDQAETDEPDCDCAVVLDIPEAEIVNEMVDRRLGTHPKLKLYYAFHDLDHVHVAH